MWVMTRLTPAATFKFQAAVSIAALYTEHYFFHTSGFIEIAPQPLNLPSFFSRIFSIHAVKVSGKNTGFISACSRADLYDNISSDILIIAG